MRISFSWKKFHKELDYAVARFITEKSKGIHTKLPSKTSLMEFMEYSYKKTQVKNETKI
jgi:hypothetical protein